MTFEKFCAVQPEGYAPTEKKLLSVTGTIGKLMKLRQLHEYLAASFGSAVVDGQSDFTFRLVCSCLIVVVAIPDQKQKQAGTADESKAKAAQSAQSGQSPASDPNQNHKFVRLGADLLSHTLQFLGSRDRRCCFAVCLGMLPVSRVDGLWKIMAEQLRSNVSLMRCVFVVDLLVLGRLAAFAAFGFVVSRLRAALPPLPRPARRCVFARRHSPERRKAQLQRRGAL